MTLCVALANGVLKFINLDLNLIKDSTELRLLNYLQWAVTIKSSSLSDLLNGIPVVNVPKIAIHLNTSTYRLNFSGWKPEVFLFRYLQTDKSVLTLVFQVQSTLAWPQVYIDLYTQVTPPHPHKYTLGLHPLAPLSPYLM